MPGNESVVTDDININTEKEDQWMAIEYLTGLNAIVMKAIWNIEKRQGRVTIQDLVEEIKRSTGKEYQRNSVSTYLRRLEKKDFIETKKEGRRSFIYSKVDESD